MEVYDQIIYQLDSTLETIEAANEDHLEGYSKNIKESKRALDALRSRKEMLGFHNLEREIDPTIVDRMGLPAPQSWEGISLMSDTFDREFMKEFDLDPEKLYR